MEVEKRCGQKLGTEGVNRHAASTVSFSSCSSAPMPSAANDQVRTDLESTRAAAEGIGAELQLLNDTVLAACLFTPFHSHLPFHTVHPPRVLFTPSVLPARCSPRRRASQPSVRRWWPQLQRRTG